MIRSLLKRRSFSRCSNSWILAESASNRAHGKIAFSKRRAQRLSSFDLPGTFLMRNRVPFPFFLTSPPSNSAPSMIVGSRSAPKSFFSSISFSKSWRISCLERETRKGFSSARLWSLTTQDESSCSHQPAGIDFAEYDLEERYE